MKKIPKSSFLYKFIVRFLCMIVIPMFVSWFLYIEILNIFYMENNLETQQINLEQSVDDFEILLSAIDNATATVQGNSEVQYYLNYYTSKTDMLYSYIRNISELINSIYLMNPYIEEINIYTYTDLELYVDSIRSFNQLPLEQEEAELVRNLAVGTTYWKLISEDCETPEIHGYRKIYTDAYSTCIGYVEVEFSTTLIDDYIEQMLGQIDERSTLIILYEDEEIYSSSDMYDISDLYTTHYETQSDYEIFYLQNQVEAFCEIDSLGLQIVIVGELNSYMGPQLNEMLTVLFSVIIGLVLLLFILFFANVYKLSERIMNFTEFIRNTKTNNLGPFIPNESIEDKEREIDELDELIQEYNTLMSDNISMISTVQKMELLNKDARYKALQAQIHPHFIYGTLETIRMMAIQDSNDDVAHMIYSLSEILRYVTARMSNEVTLGEEIRVVENYLMIQKVRFDERMDYEIHIDERLVEMEIPAFILQPIIENAIVYGASRSEEHCTVIIDAEIEDDKIIIQVSNTGPLIEKQRLKIINHMLSSKISVDEFEGNNNGLALYNIRERLKIFFNGQSVIYLESEDEITTTIIEIFKGDGKNAKNINCR